MPVRAVRGIELGHIHRLDRVQDEPNDMILAKPLPQARGQQQILLAIARQEVLGHAQQS
jgi:hypothetical protein